MRTVPRHEVERMAKPALVEYVVSLSEAVNEAEAVLKSLGYEYHATMVAGRFPVQRWEKTAAQIKAEDEEKLQREQEIAAKAAESATNLARRSALKGVIDALELREYRRPAKPFTSPLDPRPGDTEPDPDRLWLDIQTALEVRAEKKHAAERESIERKVSRLGLRQELFLIPRDSINIEAPRLSDIVKGFAEADPKKKPAKKKSEDKK